jgi:hypothetical protein
VGGSERVGLGTILEVWGRRRCLNTIKVRTLCVSDFSVCIVLRSRQNWRTTTEQLAKLTLQYTI